MAFLRHAANFVLFAPLVIFLGGALASGYANVRVLCYLIEILAFTLGLVAVVGGIRYHAPAIVRRAALGMLLNLFPLLMI